MRNTLWFTPYFLCASLIAHAAPLTLLEAQQLAVSEQPLLTAQQATARSQREAAIAAQQLPDPRLKLALQNVPTDTFSLTEDFMTMRTIAIEQMFPGGNKRALRGRRGEQEAAQSEAEFEGQKRALRRDAALAWLDLYYFTQSRLLLRQQQTEMRANVDALRISYGANKASLEEVFVTQQMLNQLRDRELELTGQIGRARASLARWIGAAAEREVAQSLPVANVAATDKLKIQLTQHPELGIYDRMIALAETDVLLAREAKKPDWSIEFAYSKRGPAYADMVSMQLGFDLPVFPANRQDRDRAGKQALLERATAQREDRLRSLNAELAAAYAEQQATLARIDALQKATLPNAQQRVRAAQISYQATKTTMSSVYEAHHAELETRLQLLAQRVALARVESRLRYFSDEENQ